jgi:hypothetical protein
MHQQGYFIKLYSFNYFRVCFQLLENENVISQEKALQLLDNGDLQDIFLKYTIDKIHKVNSFVSTCLLSNFGMCDLQ